MAGGEPTRRTLIPKLHALFALLSLAMLAALIIIPGVSALVDERPALPTGSAGGFAVLLVLIAASAALTVTLVRQRWGTLSVGARITYRRRWSPVEIDLPLAAAREVAIVRPGAARGNPTDYLLRVEVDGRVIGLLFAEHYLFGHTELGDARELAARLGVALVDPSGEHQRASRWRLVRWMGGGQEWKVALAVVVALLAIGLATAVP